MKIRHGWMKLMGVAAACALLGHPGTARAEAGERTIRVTAKRFEYAPREIVVKRGEPVVIELTSLDRKHGFSMPELGIDVVVAPGHPAQVRIVPAKAGTFSFHCSVFCGSGHEDMTGTLVVRE
jgi:cytochrome c oxidase subunit 2